MNRFLGNRVFYRSGPAEAARREVPRDMHGHLGRRLMLPCRHTELWRCDSATLHSRHASSLCLTSSHTYRLSGASSPKNARQRERLADTWYLVVHQARTELSYRGLGFLEWIRPDIRGPRGVRNRQGESQTRILHQRVESGVCGIWMHHNSLWSPCAHLRA